MIFLEIVMIVIGLGAVIYSTKVSDGAETPVAEDAEAWKKRMEEFQTKIEQFDDAIAHKQEEQVDAANEQMSKLSNEKIIGISEYSDQVIDKIEKNHAEVVFLYDMLNEKQAEIQKLIQQADSSKVQFHDELAKSYQNVKEAAGQAEEGSQKAVSEETAEKNSLDDQYDVQNLSENEKQALDAENEEKEEEKTEQPLNRNEEILSLHEKGYSVLEISKMLKMGQGEVKFVLDMYA